jgi:hypothetical protein
MKFTFACLVAVILAYLFTVEALPSPYYEYVGLGDTCNQVSRICYSPYVCGTISGRQGKFCILLRGENESCDLEYRQCAKGYTCVVKNGQYTGVCKKSSTLKRRSPIHYEYVGFADTCDNFQRFCKSGFVCDTVPGRPLTYCVRKLGLGQVCDQEYNQCANGYTCVIPSGQYRGVCQ